MMPIKLTQTVKKGGCAAKLPAGELRKILSDLKLKKPTELLVGTETMDDAALWDLGDGRLMIQTLDFFTPIVDDAEDFGAIAAANALSDVYAMGGEPKTALTILAYPTSVLPMELLGPLMRGAVERIEAAGACLAGGHSIDDETLKLGFSVTGFVEKNRAWTNAGAKPGDALILTKGLGTGTLMSALKGGEISEDVKNSAIASMKTLNRITDLLGGITVNAATDVTGFGLLGHLAQMMRASGARADLDSRSLPALPGALDSLKAGWTNRAHITNGTYVQTDVSFAESIPEELKLLTLDAQTSGGLLLSIPEKQAANALAAIHTRFPFASQIGRVSTSAGKLIHVK